MASDSKAFRERAARAVAKDVVASAVMPSEDARAFLEGRSSFTQFKDDAYLADLWEKCGDTRVATWEEGDSRPRAIDRKAKPEPV
jgi:hypothetical protein